MADEAAAAATATTATIGDEAQLAAVPPVEATPQLDASVVIRPFCITILYHNLLLFIDIFHI
jgi:hypothetical protein